MPSVNFTHHLVTASLIQYSPHLTRKNQKISLGGTAITLEKIGDTAAIGALKKLLSNPDEPGNVRIAAKEALDILTKK